MKLTKEEKEQREGVEERLFMICDSVMAKSGPTKIVGDSVVWREGTQDRFLQAVQAKYAIELNRSLREDE